MDFRSLYWKKYCPGGQSRNIITLKNVGISTLKLAISATPVVPWLSYSLLDPWFAVSNPAGVEGFFQSVKILSMTSFGREVKP